jgi:hypothetical protein
LPSFAAAPRPGSRSPSASGIALAAAGLKRRTSVYLLLWIGWRLV